MGSQAPVLSSDSGKTYTMGILDSICPLSDGLIPVSLKYIFEGLQNMADNAISVSMVQVYKDDVYDLLSPKKTPATIREDPVLFG